MSDLENLVHNAFAEMHYPNAAAELIQLRKDLEVACHVKAKDKVGFDFAVLEEIAICQGVILTLRTDLDEAIRVIRLVETYADGNLYDAASAFLAKHGGDA